MDWDQQLIFYYCYPVAIIAWDRFICQPKFAGKTYMKFVGQELKQRIRQESKLPTSISRSAAHRHAQSPIAAFSLAYADKSFSGMNWTSYPMHYENCNCLQYPAQTTKTQYHTYFAYYAYFYGNSQCNFTLSTVQLQKAAWTSINTSK